MMKFVAQPAFCDMSTKIAEAIVDRLIHPSQKITLKGEKSYREKLAEKKSGLKNQGGLL